MLAATGQQDRKLARFHRKDLKSGRQTMKMSAVPIHSGLHQEWRARQLEFFGRGQKIVGSYNTKYSLEMVMAKVLRSNRAETIWRA